MAGNDTLEGGAGADTLDGGDGIDLVGYADGTKGVSVNLATGIGSGGTATGDTLVAIEDVIGSAHDDTLTGSSAASRLTGGDGADTVDGGAGSDVLRGDAGADTLDGGADFDLVSYADSTKGVSVNLATGIGGGGTAFGDHLASIEAVTGSAYADALIGDGAANTFRGGAGADHLDGGAGAGVDTATYADSTVGVSVNLATGAGSGGTATGDTLASIENIDGSAYNDTLVGSGAVNSLKGRTEGM